MTLEGITLLLCVQDSSLTKNTTYVQWRRPQVLLKGIAWSNGGLFVLLTYHFSTIYAEEVSPLTSKRVYCVGK